MGGGASGSCGVPTWSRIGQFGVYEQKGGEDAEEEEKMEPVAKKLKKKGSW